ncbi:MAG: caspase family protein [Acidobacteria bacterium]|nr:caspase family protein [Acidobacteriota bacterium]
MRPARFPMALFLAFMLGAASASDALARQVALVVGNGTYAHIGRLPNPENDAVDLAAALRRIGFEVTTELDADRVELTEALRAFTRQSAGADVSLVFYAGHGLEMDGVNYLVPVDARLERDVDVRYETVTLDDLLVSTVGARLRLVILDACRNNPLAVRCNERWRHEA